MNHYFIYNSIYKDGNKKVSATVIFCPGSSIDIEQLQQELQQFYTNHFQTDKIIILGGSYSDNLADVILREKSRVFKYVPKIEAKSFFDNLHILVFDKSGKITELQHQDIQPFKGLEHFKKQYLNQGLTQIFVERGGLVESTGSHHHYTFPSGRKHSDKFLRVANILLYSSEIYFIAFSVLKHFNEELYKEIYCDTSSIHSVAMALNDLLNRFPGADRKIYPISSFKSYEGLYSGKLSLKSSAFILISASTSGNIVEYILKKNGELRKDNIVVLYYLNNTKHSTTALEQVACNLTKTDANPLGIEKYDTYENTQSCALCKAGSYPIEISGDVFLLEKPRVNSIRIDANDMDVKTSSCKYP